MQSEKMNLPHRLAFRPGLLHEINSRSTTPLPPSVSPLSSKDSLNDEMTELHSQLTMRAAKNASAIVITDLKDCLSGKARHRIGLFHQFAAGAEDCGRGDRKRGRRGGSGRGPANQWAKNPDDACVHQSIEQCGSPSRKPVPSRRRSPFRSAIAGDRAVIEMADNGPGIPGNHQPGFPGRFHHPPGGIGHGYRAQCLPHHRKPAGYHRRG